MKALKLAGVAIGAVIVATVSMAEVAAMGVAVAVATGLYAVRWLRFRTGEAGGQVGR